MPEELKDSKTGQWAAGKVPFGTWADLRPILDNALKGLTDPDHMMLALCDLVYAGIWNLQKEIEDGAPGVNWKNPAIALQYTVPWPEEDKVGPDQEEEGRLITAEEAQVITDRFFEALPDAFDMCVMEGLTGGVAVMTVEGEEGPKVQVLFPLDRAAEYEAVPVDQREEYAAGFLNGFTLPSPAFTGKDKKGNPFAGELHFQILPLNLDSERHRAFYLVLVALNFTEGDPSAWSPADKADLWKTLHRGLEEEAAPHLKKVGLPPVTLEPAAPPLPARVPTFRPEDFAVAAGFAPMHRLAERNRGGLPLFPEARRQFFDLRTPLNWAVGLALFSRTSEKTPDAWQEVTIADLTDRVFCLTERAAPRRGDHRTDILAEVVKLHTVRNAYVRYDWERRGRAWRRLVILGSDYAIPNLELAFWDRKTDRLVWPSDPSLRSLAIPLEVKGRRAFTPDGKDIKALPKGRFMLERIRWRWNPSFADDLKVAPALDAKGNVKRDASGRVLRGGFNIRVAVCIFDALTVLRSERAYVAHDLLILLAHDIYKPPKQSASAGRNAVEREADRLFDLLGLEADPKHPDRREETVAAAIYRLKQADIAALLPGSDERPRPPSEAELASGRRKSPFYRLVRSPDYTPTAALVTKEEAADLEADAVEVAAPVQRPALPAPKGEIAVLFPDAVAPKPVIPSGAEIRAAREAAGLNLRRFAEAMGGPDFSTWSRYESGKLIRVGSIKPDAWQRVRDFVGQHRPKADPDGGKGDA